MFIDLLLILFITVDWESCDEEEAELDDTDKAKARRYRLKLHTYIHTYIHTYKNNIMHESLIHVNDNVFTHVEQT